MNRPRSPSAGRVGPAPVPAAPVIVAMARPDFARLDPDQPTPSGPAPPRPPQSSPPQSGPASSVLAPSGPAPPALGAGPGYIARRPPVGSAPAAGAAGDLPAEKGSMGTLAFSLMLHLGIIALAVLWVVREILVQAPPEAFAPPEKRVQLPMQLREQALSNARHDAAAPRPSYSRRLASKAPASVQVPAMPEVDLKQMLPIDPSALVSDHISGAIGASGYGRGTGRGLGGGGGTGKGSGLAFFNIEDSAHSVVIMIDVSQSMFSRTGDYDSGTRQLLKTGADQAFQVIRDEAIKMIDGLGPDTRFGLLRWSGSARSWKPELVRATDANKAAAREHILHEVDANSAPPMGGRPGGTRHDYALEELLRLAPESAFMLTDGNATRSRPGGGMVPIPAKEMLDILDAAGEQSEALPRIHTIYYLTGADKKEEEGLLKDIARKTKGKFRKVEAAGVADAKKTKPKDAGRERRR